MKKRINSTNGGKDEETFKDTDLFEREKIDREISVKGTEDRSPGPHHHWCTGSCQLQRKGIAVMQKEVGCENT